MDKKQIKTVLTGDFSGIDNFIEKIIYPIFGEECFEKKDVPEQLVTSESKAAADIANVSSILNIGTISNIKSEDIELFEVTLKNTSDISRSRVGIQRLIRSALSQYSHAFIVFHYKDCENKEWRFSYLHKEGTLKNTTSAKRYTYVFGNEHNPRTATERFEILANSKKTDEDFENAFSVEALSKEFFKKYEEIYNDFVEYMIENSTIQKSFKSIIAKYDTGEKETDVAEIYKSKYKPLRDYVKKMMGRLVFLYFLERKGWLNGDKKYLTKLFNDSEKKNDFLDKVLEPLFFGVLNTPRNQRKEKFNEFGWDVAAVPGLSSIPYLNGGLFEQDELDKREAKFPKDYFERLFSFFSEYNFTVDENDPSDEEVGIDPEMLSVIFESLLEDNKGKGAFYTPKDVVQRMCREALITYLVEKTSIDETIVRKFIENTDDENIPKEIEEKKQSIIRFLVNIKICDPAIGSGAFPMGMLNLLVKVRLALCPLKNKDSNEIVELKKSIIQNNIYGVDIEKGAIDIARLRFWLSIVVDSKCSCDEAQPLPNFDYKFMQGDSLVPTFDGKYVELSVANAKTAAGESISAGGIVKKNLSLLFECRQEFFGLFGKDKYKKEIEIKEVMLDTLEAIFNAELTSVKASCPTTGKDCFGVISPKIQKEIDVNLAQQKEIKEVLEKIDNLKKSLHDNSFSLEDRAKTDIGFFDWTVCFSDVMKDGFDIVIGNPPYVSTKGVAKDSKPIFEQVYGFSDDLYNMFTFLGMKILKEGGSLTYITPKTFWTTQTKKNMRDLMLGNDIQYIFDSANPFESAMVDTCITQVLKKPYSEGHKIKFYDGSKDLKKPSIFPPIKQSVYIESQNSVIFKPNEQNLKIWTKYNSVVKELFATWWKKIETSKKISQNAEELAYYRKHLKPGDVALLGCLTEGGQGLATANNGKYIAVRSSTKWANNIRMSRPQKLADAIKKNKKIKDEIACENLDDFFEKKSEKEIAILFDNLKEKYGRDIFGQGYIYKIVDDDEMADVASLTQDEKENGIDESKKYFVPYDKGDKDGNRWYLETPFAIAWSKSNVRFLKTNSGKKGAGMPVVRNPQFNFKEGFCWTLLLNEYSEYQKARLKLSSVNDVNAMALYPYEDFNKYLKFYVCLFNSFFVYSYKRNFISGNAAFQINDARQLPIIIPSDETLEKFDRLFDEAYAIKKRQFSSPSSYNANEDEIKMSSIQKKLDDMVNQLYQI